MMADPVVDRGAGLTILDDPCRGCGACCEYAGAPPGYAPAYLAEEVATDDWWQGQDGQILRAMPIEVRATLDDYYRGVREGLLVDREQQAQPCLWYDPVARRCSHYSWRPSPCRDFEPGGDDCLGVREYAGR